jgi:hypothetical protein
MTKFSVLAAVLALALGACSDADGSDAVAGVVTVAPIDTVTATVMSTLTATATLTATPTATPTPASGPTPAQLQRALLTAKDLGPDAVLWDFGEMETRYPAVRGYGFLVSPEEFLTVELHDARNGVPDYLALGFLNDLTVNQVTQVAATGFGTNGVRYRYNLDEDGERVYGEVAAWRQGQVVVAIQVEGYQADVCVCDYAKAQYDKLAAAMR